MQIIVLMEQPYDISVENLARFHKNNILISSTAENSIWWAWDRYGFVPVNSKRKGSAQEKYGFIKDYHIRSPLKIKNKFIPLRELQNENGKIVQTVVKKCIHQYFLEKNR